jgi:dephospho-CoA kinase
MIVGLTGSMGMGKSTVSEMFRERGIPVFCMDRAVSVARGPYGDALPAIEKLIPGSTNPMTGADLGLLRSFAFAKPENLEALEAVLKPCIEQQLSVAMADMSDEPIVVWDVPLLFERGFDTRVDKIIVVSTTPEIQMQRVMRRGTLNADQARDLIARQMPSAEKVARADYVIDTSNSLKETEKQVDAILETLG